MEFTTQSLKKKTKTKRQISTVRLKVLVSLRRFHLSGAAIDVSASLDFALGLGSGFLEISSLVWAHVSSCPASQASRSTFSS